MKQANKATSGSNPPPRGVRQARKARHHAAIIEATVSCIANHGLSGVTVSRICTLSGVSRGMINAHFINKDNLLLEVLRSISSDYLNAVEHAVAQYPEDPDRALMTEIETEINFWRRSHEESCTWFAFRAEALSNSDYLSLCGPRESALFAIPVRLCNALAKKTGQGNIDGELIARGLCAMLEGFWFDHVCDPQGFAADDALKCCLDFLRGHFPDSFKS